MMFLYRYFAVSLYDRILSCMKVDLTHAERTTGICPSQLGLAGRS